jgi:ArsR family transcriptional regulator
MAENHTVTPDRSDVVAHLTLLADPLRFRLVQQLRLGDYRVGELVASLQAPQSLLSYHLGTLHAAGLIENHRSDADGRSLYYGLNRLALQEVYTRLGTALGISSSRDSLPYHRVTIVVVCTRNSVRSQMAEGWLRHLYGGQVVVRSGGVAPGALDPLAVEVMAEVGVDIGHQVAKPLTALQELPADLLITVCDRARERCDPAGVARRHIHWSIPNPAVGAASDTIQVERYRATRDALQQRVVGLWPVLPLILDGAA